MKKQKLRLRAKVAAGILAALTVILILSLLFFGASSAIAAGRTYLNEQKNKDVEMIKAQFEEIQRQELHRQLKAGTIQIFDVFQDYLFLGDSRVVGYYTYGFFPQENVLADAGNTINTIPERLSTIQERQPKNIIISYGVNDMGLNIGEGEGEPGYDVVFEEHVKQILEVAPDANIFINSIIPATPEAVNRSPNWGRTSEFNAKIKAMCKRNNWIFIDNTSLAADGTADIYQSDGVHFLKKFYSVWANNIYTAMEEARSSLKKTTEEKK